MSTRPGLARGGRKVAHMRELLRQRDGDDCGRCGRPIDFGQPGTHPDGPTIGHIVPAVKGGHDGMTNLRLEHGSCNYSAGARTASPRAKIVRPVAVVSLLAGLLLGSTIGTHALTMSDREQALRTALTACAILDAGARRGIDASELRVTYTQCRRVRAHRDPVGPFFSGT